MYSVRILSIRVIPRRSERVRYKDTFSIEPCLDRAGNPSGPKPVCLLSSPIVRCRRERIFIRFNGQRLLKTRRSYRNIVVRCHT